MASKRIVPLSEYHRLPLATSQTSDVYKRLLEVVCNNATLALFIMDEHQQCVYMNPAAETLTGYNLLETKGRALHDVIHHTRPNGQPYPLCECPIDQAFPQNNQEQGEEVFVHKDGHFYPVAYTASPIREGDQVVGTIIEVRDITREKLEEQVKQEAAQREQALRREAEAARQRVETVLSSISDGVFVLDRNWCYTYANDRLCKMAGKSLEELIGHNNWDLFPDAINTDVYVQFHRAMKEQVQLQFEYLYLPWHRWFEYRVYPAEQGITVFAAEVTARKQSEEALQQTLQKLDFHFENTPMAVVEWTGNFQVVRWSGSAEQIFGWRSDEVVDHLLSDLRFVHEDDSEQVTGVLERLKSGEEPYVFSYNRNYTKHGDVIHCEWYNSSLRDESGQMVSVLSLVLDVTDKKQAETEREQLLVREQAARAEAERANRVKDEFLAIVSHELRAPLNPILGWSRLLLDQKLDAAKTTQALSTIARNAKQQADLIEDLLDVSRILRGKLSLTVGPVDLVSTIQSALETVRLSAEAKAIQLHIMLQPGVGLVSGDPGRLQQVVWNLLSNAIKFTPSGGRVSVQLENLGSTAQIRVSDTGKGIHPDFLPHVFAYFRQEDGATTRQFGGLGLGLAIVRHLVELHGGTVEAESPGEGQGATFTVKLPLMSDLLESSQDNIPLEPDLNLTGIQVLVVDDDTDTRDFVAFLLEQFGAKVVTSASAGEALVSLTRSQPDVIVSDIGMPEVDGYMLLRQVRALPFDQGGQIPAIALTAYVGEIDQKQATAAGFQRHLAKPIEPQILIQTIRMLYNKRYLE